MVVLTLARSLSLADTASFTTMTRHLSRGLEYRVDITIEYEGDDPYLSVSVSRRGRQIGSGDLRKHKGGFAGIVSIGQKSYRAVAKLAYGAERIKHEAFLKVCFREDKKSK